MNNQHSRTADNIYLNVTVNNDNTQRKVANYTAEYENPIVDNPSEYELAVVKFQIPLDEIPLFIMPVVPGQTLTPGSGTAIQTPFEIGVYQVEASADIVPPTPAPNPPATNYNSATVEWIPQWWNYPNPTSGAGTINLDDVKYTPITWVYSYQSVLTQINLALEVAWTAAGSPGTLPFYIYSDDKFKLVMPHAFVSAATTYPGSQGWSVYMNENLAQVLQGWDYIITNNRYEIPIDYLTYSRNYWAGADLQPNATPTYYVIPQEYTSFEYLSSARKIVMTSNTIPCRKEYYPVPSNSTTPSSVTGVNNGLGIISDFQLDLTNKPGEQRSIATYESDLYRYIDLNSTHPMRKIDLNFYWADEFNNLFPLYINKHGIINVKLGFFRKDSDKVKPQNYDVVGSGRRSVFY